MAYFSADDMADIKTIDELMDATKKYYAELGMYSKEYYEEHGIDKLIINSEHSQILEVLRKETNVPSIYDLSIIRRSQMNLKPAWQKFKSSYQIHKEILEIYKNRKE